MVVAKAYVNEFFSLNSECSNRLQRLKPDFGYDGYGELVFYRTYSRVKHNGGQENWADVVTRTVNGCFSIRKDFYIRNYIAWNEEYWQAYASRMALSLFNMYWMPGGRGLWAMGTPFVYERGSMALNNCFDGDTKFIGNQGVEKLKDWVGKSIRVLTRMGEKNAEVKSFGEQKLFNICFKPTAGNSNYRLVYKATRDHRWILVDRTETTSLVEGDRVVIKPNIVKTDTQDYNDGFVHGLIFADGCNHYKDKYYIQLCGWKEKYRSLLEKSKFYYHTIATEQRMIFCSPEEALKAFPENSQNIEYKQGFFDAWRSMDGHYKKEACCIDSCHGEAFNWVMEHSGFLNYVLVGHSIENGDTNYGKRNAPLHRIKVRFEPVEFIVDTINNACETKEVYCVVEPETHSFMLAGGIVTGNCGNVFLKGNEELANDYHWMMDALMLGVGVGFDAKRTGLKIYKPNGTYIYEIQDNRESWCDSIKLLIEAYILPGRRKPIFKYDKIRPEGVLIKGFGGKASGPAPLMRLHEQIHGIFERANLDEVRLKADIANMIGCCVVAGNVRRSAELMMGDINDPVFMNLKDYEKNPERQEFGWMSNNTAKLYYDADFEELGEVARRVITRGEPGIANHKNFPYGRIGKKIPVRRDKAKGLNPCGEVPLEDFELCNVSETLPTRCQSVQSWYEACEFATMYCSSVSLLPTHREETNRIVARNRRIAVGIVDWTGWVYETSLNKVTSYMRKGYNRVTKTNQIANAEAGVPEAIRKTTIKLVA